MNAHKPLGKHRNVHAYLAVIIPLILAIQVAVTRDRIEMENEKFHSAASENIAIDDPLLRAHACTVLCASGNKTTQDLLKIFCNEQCESVL